MVLSESKKRSLFLNELDFLFNKTPFGGDILDFLAKEGCSKSKKSPDYYMNPVNAYVDAEWGSDGVTLCLQVLLHSFTSPAVYYIVMNEKYRDFLSQKGYVEGNKLPFYQGHLLFSDFDDARDNLTPLVQQFNICASK